jgi:uncharacterized protein YjdB
MARSGLSGQTGPTWTSSDNSIANVVAGQVTGIATGTATITGVEDNKTRTYTVKVV